MTELLRAANYTPKPMLDDDLETKIRDAGDSLRRQLDRRRFRSDTAYLEAIVNRAVASASTAADHPQ